MRGGGGISPSGFGIDTIVGVVVVARWPTAAAVLGRNRFPKLFKSCAIDRDILKWAAPDEKGSGFLIVPLFSLSLLLSSLLLVGLH